MLVTGYLQNYQYSVNDTMKHSVSYGVPDHDCSIAQTSCICRDLPVPAVQTALHIHHEDRSLFFFRHTCDSHKRYSLLTEYRYFQTLNQVVHIVTTVL